MTEQFRLRQYNGYQVLHINIIGTEPLPKVEDSKNPQKRNPRLKTEMGIGSGEGEITR